MRDITINRPTLGKYVSARSFRYLSDDAEELAGRALVVDAGRQYGHDIMEQLGVLGSHQSADKIFEEVKEAMGENGSKLCLINSLEEHDDGGFEVHATECACITFTLGALIGAISAVTGSTMLGKEASEDGNGSMVYHIYPLS
jgi:hypothetical protein